MPTLKAKTRLGPEPTGAGERDLVLAARDGSRDAFGQLVERYKPRVYSFALGLTGNAEEGEDLAQDSFVEAWRNLGKLREPERFRSWLFVIARNLCRRRHRGNRRLSSLEDRAGVISMDPSPLDRMISREEERYTFQALARVPEIYRVPLVLFYREDHSVERVAQLLELTEENVRKRIHRGRRMIQARILRLMETALAKPRPRTGFTGAVMTAIVVADSSASISAGVRAKVARSNLLLGGVAAIVALPLVLQLASSQARGRSALAAAGSESGSSLSTSSFAGWSRNLGSRLATRFSPPMLSVPGDAPLLPPQPRRVLDFDFEDGLVPESRSAGQTGSCPPRIGSSYCWASELSGPYLHSGFWADGELFRYSRALVLSFEYWVAKDAPVSVQLSASDGQQYHFHIRHPTVGQWTHVDVPLEKAVVIDRAGAVVGGSPPEGQWIRGLYFATLYIGGQAFYMDDVSLAER